MQRFPGLLAFCGGNLPVTGEFPSQRAINGFLKVKSTINKTALIYVSTVCAETIFTKKSGATLCRSVWTRVNDGCRVELNYILGCTIYLTCFSYKFWYHCNSVMSVALWNARTVYHRNPTIAFLSACFQYFEMRFQSRAVRLLGSGLFLLNSVSIHKRSCR